MKDYAAFLSERFGGKVQKLAVNAGFTCPNRDGTVGRGGCTYCTNAAFNPSYCDARLSVAEQLERGKAFFARKYRSMRYLAYFQAYSNTHAPVETLRAMHDEALAVDGVVGIVIATRPDCLPDDVVDYLLELSQRTVLIVELGVESSHDETLKLINRCHDWATVRDAVDRLTRCGITVGVHLILGLPGETEEMMEATVSEIAALPVSLIKFHQMQVLRGTRLAAQYERHEVELAQWTAGQYAALCARLLKLIPPHMVVERFVSQSPPSMLIAPRWNLKPGEWTELLNKKIEEI
ncbi:MAG: TIGR01212 family radical SAM protein [Muribaculaceae bacterium]|nr:TIGR01212 family radical SAM protein [Muribaculaceae bacterium]